MNERNGAKVYTYTRVSTIGQVDGYSLEAQRTKMKAFADYQNMQIVGEYSDEGISGKNIEKRTQFKQMLYDMFTKKITQDGLSSLWVYVSISDAATVTPLDGAPKLGTPGDFSANRTYRVTAADGSYSDYVLETIKGF